MRREIVDKYELCRRHVVPWVGGVAPLRGETMIEIGSGTGAKSAAFAQVVDQLAGCDISESHVRAAEARIAALGVRNVTLRVEDAQTFLERARRDHPDGVGLCLLFAVLEHLTLEERLATLRDSWELLRPGGAMIVVETPNRLLPWDWHSSRLPFFHQLPDELALLYFERSPRREYVDAIREGMAEAGREGGLRELTRQGRGVSYHEFEVAIGSLDGLVIADSYDPEIVEMNPVTRDELELRDFLTREAIDVPVAFSRYWLDLVLRKPVV